MVPEHEQFLAYVRGLNPDLTIVRAGPSEAVAFLRFLNSYFARQKPSGYVEWQYLEAPHPASLMLAFDQGDIVGSWGGCLRGVAGRRASLFMMDLLVREDYRNRGVALLLEAALTDEARSLDAGSMCALPNPMGRETHLAIPEWCHVGQVTTLDVKVTDLEASDIPSLEGVPSRNMLQFEYDASHEAWRFDANPEYGYERIESAANACAWIKVFRDPTTGAAFGDIVDYRYPPHEPDKLLSLWSACARRFREQGVDTVTAWALPHTSTDPVARAAGFAASKQRRDFVVKPLAEGQDDLLDWDRWYMLQSDSEVY